MSSCTTDVTCWASPATELTSLARTLLLRGMLAGVLAGLLAVGFATLFGEPQIELAIGFESLMEHAAGHAPEPELVSRAVQRSAGLLTAGMASGAALGGIVALVFAFAYQRIGRFSPRALAALLAGAGFVAIVLVPQLKYPANPPSIGAPETIGMRTALYFEIMLIAVAALVLAVLLGRRLLARFGGWNASLVATLAFICIVTLVQFVLPDVNEVLDGFPAVVLWRFRIAALGIQFVLWASFGVIFGVLAERAFFGRIRPAN
jgi:Probable cobalt transporter subunit (CbtA)